MVQSIVVKHLVEDNLHLAIKLRSELIIRAMLKVNRRDGVVVRASASHLADLGFIP